MLARSFLPHATANSNYGGRRQHLSKSKYQLPACPFVPILADFRIECTEEDLHRYIQVGHRGREPRRYATALQVTLKAPHCNAPRILRNGPCAERPPVTLSLVPAGIPSLLQPRDNDSSRSRLFDCSRLRPHTLLAAAFQDPPYSFESRLLKCRKPLLLLLGTHKKSGRRESSDDASRI